MKAELKEIIEHPEFEDESGDYYHGWVVKKLEDEINYLESKLQKERELNKKAINEAYRKGFNQGYYDPDFENDDNNDIHT